jgi:hypothetical protein
LQDIPRNKHDSNVLIQLAPHALVLHFCINLANMKKTAQSQETLKKIKNPNLIKTIHIYIEAVDISYGKQSKSYIYGKQSL